METNLREGGEAAARRRRRDLGGVDGSNEAAVADTNTGDESAEHEKGIVGSQAHENGSDEEEGGGKSHGVTAADPVGSSAGGRRAYNGVEADNPDEDFDLHVGDSEILFDEDHGSAHYTDICKSPMKSAMRKIRGEIKRMRK